MNWIALFYAFYAVGVIYQFQRGLGNFLKISRREDPEAQTLYNFLDSAKESGTENAAHAGFAAASIALLVLISLFWPLAFIWRMLNK